jgi:hypothetical protein
MGMALTDDDLLPGEHWIRTKLANMVISVKEYGLSRFAFDKYMGLVGMKGREAIGGNAHLTNYRIIFKSHGINRVRGTHSILLPNVTDVSAGLLNLHVETQLQKFKFVMWFKKSFVADAQQAKGNLKGDNLEKLRQAILEKPEALGEGLKKWATAELINKICLAGTSVQNVLEQLTGSDANNFLEIIELFTEDDDE